MIEYNFTFDEKTVIQFKIDNKHGLYISDVESPPEWLSLNTHTCSHCLLKGTERKACPAAQSIELVVNAFAKRKSYEQVRVMVRHHELTIEITTAIQDAARSLVGLLLAFSDCPTMTMLRPMAHFHLPFGDEDETLFRVSGMYLLAQFVRKIDGQSSDWNLDGLLKLYKDIHEVNKNLAARVRLASEGDANVNSVIILDSLVHSVVLSVEKRYRRFQNMFAMYLNDTRYSSPESDEESP